MAPARPRPRAGCKKGAAAAEAEVLGEAEAVPVEPAEVVPGAVEAADDEVLGAEVETVVLEPVLGTGMPVLTEVTGTGTGAKLYEVEIVATVGDATGLVTTTGWLVTTEGWLVTTEG